jgi:tetratricopeptide (TPR) repeat protein
MRFKLNLLIFLFILSASLPALANQNIEPPFEQAIDIQDIQNFLSTKPTNAEIDNAITKLEDLTKKEPQNYLNYEMLGLIYDYLREPARALGAFKLAEKYSPQNNKDIGILYTHIARQYLSLGRFEEAKPFIYKAIAVIPDNIYSQSQLASYYIAKDMHKEAAEKLKVLSEIDKEKDYYYNFYIYALQNLRKNNEQIIALFKEGVKVNPKSYQAHRILATALRDCSNDIKKDFPEIITELNKAWKLNPKYIFTCISFADTYMIMGLETKKDVYFKKCLWWFEKAQSLAPGDLKVAYSMGIFFLNTGQYSEAIAKFEYIYNQGDSSEAVVENLVHAYNNQADSYYISGENLEEGLLIIAKAIQLKPHCCILLNTKAQLLYKLKRFEGAYQCIQEAISLCPDDNAVIRDFENIKKALNQIAKQ